jgi:hypothetical protein
LRLSRILAKKGIDLDEGYSHLHPCPPQTKKIARKDRPPPKKKKKEKRKKKKRTGL